MSKEQDRITFDEVARRRKEIRLHIGSLRCSALLSVLQLTLAWSEGGGSSLFSQWRSSAKRGAGEWVAKRRRDARSRGTSVPLRIPIEKDTIAGYVEALKALAAAPGTRLYIDTSFLVWLTALGPEARAEFTNWIQTEAPGRVHVPVWAAHEYFRHHVDDLHGKKMAGVARDLNRLADETYLTLRPYLDASVAGDPRTPAAIITAARSSLIEIKQVADIAAAWRKAHYETNANAVITLINELGINSPPLLDWMTDLQDVERARYEGRIPPGFQDRGKSEADGIGSNGFGDLIFWKEILDHARKVRASGIIVISNDGKNDWVMGGQDQPELDEELKIMAKGLPPLPLPHPMLTYEAKAVAAVTDLMLVDRKYLAIFLRRTGRASEHLFAAAIDVNLPSARQEQKTKQKHVRDVAMGRSKPDRRDERPKGPQHLPVDDSPNMADTRFALMRALTASALPDNEKTGPLLERMLGAEGEGLNSFLTPDELSGWDNASALWLARSLASRSIAGDTLATAYCTDILGVFERLPPKTATLLYLGLLAGTYLDGDLVRTIPTAPWLDQLLALQSSPRAGVAIEAFLKHIQTRQGRPVYLPAALPPEISVKPRLESAPGGRSRLVGLQVAGVGVIVEAQDDPTLRLSNRFQDRDTVTLVEVVRDVCSTLGIPFNQIEPHDALERPISFGATVGIAAEADLRDSMEEKA